MVQLTTVRLPIWHCQVIKFYYQVLIRVYIVERHMEILVTFFFNCKKLIK